MQKLVGDANHDSDESINRRVPATSLGGADDGHLMVNPQSVQARLALLSQKGCMIFENLAQLLDDGWQELVLISCKNRRKH